MQFSADSRALALKQDRLIRVRKTRTNVDVLLPHLNPIIDLMFMDDSSNRLLSLMEPGYLLLWDVHTVESLSECLGLNLTAAGQLSRSIPSLQESPQLRLSLLQRPDCHGFSRPENAVGTATGHGCRQGDAPENRLCVSS